MISPLAARWFADRRGIKPETLEAFGAYTDAEDVVVFPYGEARKYRKGFEKDERKFWWDPPGSAGQLPFLPPDFEPCDHMLLVEGETDTMALWQAAPPELRKGIVGLSGTNAWKDRYAEELFGPAKKVFVVFDRDDPYENADAAKATGKAWEKVRASLGRKARRVVLPQGINDVAEFFQRYDYAAMRVLLKEAAKPKRNFPRLDLTAQPPPTEWLVEGLISMSEVTGLFGESGIGKSFFTMALALAVAGEEKTWLGREIHRHGPVLYVDEENSRDLVLQRLNALGMEEHHLENLDYLCYAGVNLFEEPELLLEDAVDLEPALIVLGTLSSLSVGVKSENDSVEMTRVIRRGIVPLARETGAAVVMEHHVGVDTSRPRGSTAIKQNVDSALMLGRAKDKRGHETGNINLFPAKERRHLGHIVARIHGEVDEGHVRVEVAHGEEADEAW